MSPRSGGEAAKFGERYEGRWTTRHLLYVLLGDVDSVTVEDVGEISLGAEFTVRRGVHCTARRQGRDSSGQAADRRRQRVGVARTQVQRRVDSS
jgi:hypothetical protein